MIYCYYYKTPEDYVFKTSIRSRAVEKKYAKGMGYVGYISGSRYFDNTITPVMVFFKEYQPLSEVQRRRDNGLLRAKWYNL
jgi:hypothetical protein